MEVVVPPPQQLDFNFDSGHSSPYTTAPSSPQRLNNFFYFSAPTSPTRVSSFYNEFHDISLSSGNPSPSSSSAVPFNWEEKPGTPKAKVVDKDNADKDNREEFEFNFSGQLDRTSLSAEELFDRGKIRPLKPPPGYDFSSQSSSPRSPSSRALLNKKKDFDPFQAALEETRKREVEVPVMGQERGRERTSSARKKGSSRSLSPLRVSDIMFEPEESTSGSPNPHKIISTTASSSKLSYASSIFSALSFSSKGSRKWKLKDLLLFRSASEGRPSGSSSSIMHGGSRENSVGKYAVLSKKEVIDDVKNSSFRSTEGSVGGSSRRRRTSAEVHYTVNRAVAKEMRRKTPLPYKQGLLGCLGFNYLNNPSVHDLSRGIRSLTRGR